MTTMQEPVVLAAATTESLDVPVLINTDPTGTPPAFCLTARGATAPGSFTNGAWNGTWDATTTRAIATTPLLGTGGLTLTSGSEYDLWMRVTVGSETPTAPVGVVIVL